MSILLENYTDLVPINEAYYGKPKEFLKIEKKLEAIIEMIKTTKENPVDAIDINAMKEVEEIEKLFTSFFKNKETSITFYTPLINPNYNAYTIPSSLSYFKKDSKNKRLTRVDDLFINVNIDIGLVYGTEMTPQELMAIILHEIGHCFDASFFMFLTNFNIYYIEWYKNGVKEKTEISIPHSIINTGITFLLRSEPFAKIHQTVNRIVSKSPFLSKFISDFQMAFTDIMTFFNYLSILRKPSILSMLNPANIFGYSGEKFADSFASSYGYGPDAVSIFNKIEKHKGMLIQNNIAKIPVLNIGMDLLKVASKAAFLLFDPHPDNIVRINSQLEKLKRDIKDPNLKNEVKKELQSNINDIEKYINDVVLNSNEEDNKERPISYLWNILIIKVFKGRLDPREWAELVFNHEL